jgi:hypothetical protein
MLFSHQREKGLNRIGNALKVVLIGRSKWDVDRTMLNNDITSDISVEMSIVFFELEFSGPPLHNIFYDHGRLQCMSKFRRKLKTTWFPTFGIPCHHILKNVERPCAGSFRKTALLAQIFLLF